MDESLFWLIQIEMKLLSVEVARNRLLPPSHFGSPYASNNKTHRDTYPSNEDNQGPLPDKSPDCGSAAPAFQAHALATDQLSPSPKLQAAPQHLHVADGHLAEELRDRP